MRTLIVEDHEIVDQSLRIILNEVGLCRHPVSARTIADALEQASNIDFDFIILDLILPDGCGEQILDFYTCRTRMPKILVHSASSNPNLIRRCLEKGALGCISKASPTSELVRGIKKMADNASGHICESYQESLETADDYIDPKKALTKREFQVAHLLTQGNSVKEVAAELNITYKTVDTMKTSAMKKLGVNKVTQLVRLFSEESYVQTSNGHGTG